MFILILFRKTMERDLHLGTMWEQFCPSRREQFCYIVRKKLEKGSAEEAGKIP
jgi:hypothetical protein